MHWCTRTNQHGHYGIELVYIIQKGADISHELDWQSGEYTFRRSDEEHAANDTTLPDLHRVNHPKHAREPDK